MAKSSGGIIWALIVFFGGFLGIDKLLKGSLLWFVIKLLTAGFFGIGNIIEVIFALLGKYKVNPLDYFK